MKLNDLLDPVLYAELVARVRAAVPQNIGGTDAAALDTSRDQGLAIGTPGRLLQAK